MGIIKDVQKSDMKILVQKYGGTSVGSMERIDSVAKRVINSLKVAKHNHDKARLVVVVSAMSGHTDELIKHAHFFTQKPNPKELDMLLSSGERITSALLAIALNSMGFSAISLSGEQAGIITDNAHTQAKIIDINTKNIKSLLAQDKIVVVAGFQGISTNDEITTLGRGGSDLSAVALAGALGAYACEIYSDVDGIYTTDPRIVKSAKKIPQISYDEMLELSSLGAKVLQSRSVELAKKNNIKLFAKSSFSNDVGTCVLNEENIMEKPLVRGIALDKNEAIISIFDVKNCPILTAKIFKALADGNINVDMIVKSLGRGDFMSLDFSVPKNMLDSACEILKQRGIDSIKTRDDVAKVSVVGVGMKSHSGVASSAFSALAESNIDILMIGTSEIKISMMVEAKHAESALLALHSTYNLDR